MLPVKSVQLFERIRPVVPIVVFELVESGLLVLDIPADGVERAAVEPHAVQHLDLLAEDLFRLIDAVMVLVEQDGRVSLFA